VQQFLGLTGYNPSIAPKTRFLRCKKVLAICTTAAVIPHPLMQRNTKADKPLESF
jgi:hypothetical protein